MRQYLDAKRQYRDAIVFFRMGDFYEMFYEDALVASRALELTLTSRSKDASGNGIPMCGIPYHAADGYLARLVKRGFRVAVCEQVEDPKKAKGVVKREVVRIVSPGTLTDASYLDAREPAFLMSLVEGRDVFGAALIDLSTGEFTAAEYRGADGLQALADEITVLRPREVVVARRDVPDVPVTAEQAAGRTAADAVEKSAGDGRPAPPAGLVARLPDIARLQIPVTEVDGWVFEPEAARRTLLDQLRTHGLEGFGLDGRTAAVQAAGALVAYLRDTQKADLAHVRTVAFRQVADRLLIDPTTLKHLEVVVGSEGGLPGSLLNEIDRTATSMGGRLLRAWLLRPLCALERIRDRLDAVEELAFRSIERGKCRETLKSVHDLERLVARAALGTAGPRDLVALRQSLVAVPRVKLMLDEVQAPLLKSLVAELDELADVRDRVAATLTDEPPALKEYEEKVLGADERILERELEIFEALRAAVAAEAGRIQDTARALATLDVLAGLAETAAIANFTKPHVHDGDEFVVTDGRHPVVERHAGGSFVPNDIDLNGTTRQLVVLTGPNMGGKSTYLRQTALIPLLAQIGSFVPARDAKVPIVDRIFARVGASDNIARGQSTFMVEMQETANILHTATSRSLVVLDEIGRGTATFDGLSIAWAVAEYLATNPRARPKTLFATHYHELTDLSDALPGVVNAHVAAREWKDDIIFLRKIVPGRSDRSYGIQVARLAGLPARVVGRAREILAGLERDEASRGGRPTLSGASGDVRSSQLGLFAAAAEDNEVVRRLQAIDVDSTTPRQALDLLAELKRLAES